MFDTRSSTWYDPKSPVDSLEHQIKTARQGRHGEGVHNVAEICYGTSSWDVRFSLPVATKRGMLTSTQTELLVKARRKRYRHLG